MSYNWVFHIIWEIFNERVAFPLKCSKNLTSVLKSVRPNSLYPGDVVRQAQHFYVTKDQWGVECIRLTELLARLHPHTYPETNMQPTSHPFIHPSIHLSIHPFIYSVSLTLANLRQCTTLCSTFPCKDLTSIGVVRLPSRFICNVWWQFSMHLLFFIGALLSSFGFFVIMLCMCDCLLSVFWVFFFLLLFWVGPF